MCNEQCCCSNGHEQGHMHRRRLLTKTEKAEKLKNYAEELKKELTAVEEHIKELSS